MPESVKTTFWVLLYAVLTGISLSLFTQIEGFIKYVFSLLALYIGIRFFRRYETLGLRALYISLSIVLFLLSAVIIAIIVYIQQNPEALTGA